MEILMQLEKNTVDKFDMLSNIGFSVICFTAVFSQFYSTTVKICFLGDPLSTSLSILSISGVFWKFPNFLKLKFLSLLTTCEMTHILAFR